MKITEPRTDGPPLLLAGDVGGGGGGGSGGGTITVTGLQGVPVCTDTPALDDVLTFDGTEWCPAPAASSGAPTDVDYLVGTASGALSAEIVVGTTPGGELGGTWASPTVDSTHSGSAHTDFIPKAIVDAKGDLIAASADNTPVRVAVGADGTFLKADSGATAGVSWGAGGGIGPLLLASDHGVPIVFDDILQASDGSDFLYASAP